VSPHLYGHLDLLDISASSARKNRMPIASIKEAVSSIDVPVSQPFDSDHEHPKVAQRMALLALSHTAIEHRLYEVMHTETLAVSRNAGSFSIRRLLGLSGLRSYGSVRRGCSGLMQKLSIESIGQDQFQRSSLYRVFSPEEIFARRRAAGQVPYPDGISVYESNRAFNSLIQHLVGRDDLSRREALVVLCCVEGLSNAEIGKRLQISEQTVKSHLRRVFDKFGVKRRTELVSRLLMRRGIRKPKNGKSPIESRMVAPVSKTSSFD
jgi:DNA-binding CsgD family transcriptional regulator